MVLFFSPFMLITSVLLLVLDYMTWEYVSVKFHFCYK